MEKRFITSGTDYLTRWPFESVSSIGLDEPAPLCILARDFAASTHKGI